VVNVAILGSTGMLGSTLTRVLDNNTTVVYEFNRSGISITKKNESRKLNVVTDNDFTESFNGLKVDYIINCIGLIKHLINIKDQDSIKLAYNVNAEFPLKLNNFAKRLGIPVIQIGTDCVYSGKIGAYAEDQPHDPTEVYGITKSIGEIESSSTMIIRCSIIGKEIRTTNSLLSWVLSQTSNSRINGFTNHLWNGVTTLHFSQIISGIIKSGTYKHGVSHLVPDGVVSKYELINLIAKEFGRCDLQVSKFEAETEINRSLITLNPQQNLSLWQNGGYNRIPTIEEMVSTYALWTKSELIKN
jgi:dTDP-4-dehydrorhamnose reductase